MATATSATGDADVDVDSIQDLVDSYNDLAETERAQEREAAVRQHYINPLLRALGWDTELREEVRPEHETDVGPADYAVMLNGVDQYYVEAKRFSRDLDGERTLSNGEKQKLADQAIDYAYHQRCDWAVLTNFEEIRLYWTHVARGEADDGLVLQLSVDEYLTDEGLEDLSKLSKERVRQGSLEALERARDRDPITEAVLNTLSDARVALTRDIYANHADLDEDLLREGVQRILDRLVVMRVAEDRGIITHDTLRVMMEAWDTTAINPDQRRLIKDLTNSFLDFDSVYNSTLFARHPCEEWTISNDVLKDTIESFYEYNFEFIDADILGSIYEDYLGHAIEEKSDEEGITLAERSDERREGGVFYTPTPVVEYIVDSTLGERLDGILDDVESELEGDDPNFDRAWEEFSQVEDLRVLDVSCGSGSFLIQAYDKFIDAYDKYEELVRAALPSDMGLSAHVSAHRRPDDYRQRILRNNIFGVDLDPQATEIASVNLFLQALHQDEAVPTMLEENIRRGNSLLNGPANEVADLLGVDVEEAEALGAFDWEEKFDGIFEDGGFDVIVGNPPWGASMDSYKEWVEEEYQLATGQYDTYELFIELTGNVLREGGSLGFIIPDSLFSDESDNVREWLVERQLDQVHKLGEGVFPNVFAATAIIQYTVSEPDPNNEVEVSLLQKEDREKMMGRGGDALANVISEKRHFTRQGRIMDDDDYTVPVWAGEADYAIMETMEEDTVDWSEVLDNGRGDEIGKDGNIMRCPACMEWDTYPQSRAKSKGGGYYEKTCTHCGHEYEFEEAVETKSIIRKDTPPSDDWKKLYVGEDVNRYRLTGNSWIDDSVDGIGLKSDWRFEAPKLLIREAGFGFYATVEYEDGRCLKSVLCFRPHDDREDPYDKYDVEYFLGMLNTRLMLYYYAKEQGIVEWQSYPRHPQSFIKSLPIPAVDFDDDDEREAYEEFVELVREAVGDNNDKIDTELDWEIERRALDLYGIPEEDRGHIWGELKKLARLHIVRELFPEETEDEEE